MAVVATADGIMHDQIANMLSCRCTRYDYRIANTVTSRGTIYEKDLTKSFKNK